MMKKILLLLLLTMPLSAAAETNIWDKFYIDGEFRTAYLSDKNVPDRFAPAGTMQNYDMLPTRLMFGVGYRPNENINLFAQGVYFTLWNRDGGQPVFTDSQVDRVRLLQAYIDFNNIFDAVDLRIGRQIYFMDEFYLFPNMSNFERLIYQSMDGASATVRLPMKTLPTTLYLVAGWEAPLADWSEPDVFVYGFQSHTSVNDIFSFALFWYQYQAKSDEYYGVYGIKPRINYNDLFFGLRYARAYDADSRFGNQGQFFMIEGGYDYKTKPMVLSPRANVIWTTGEPYPKVIDFIRSLIVESIYGQRALKDAAIYNAGFDFVLNSLPKAKFMFDGYYYQSRHRAQAPDKGLELNLKAKYEICKNTTLGIGGAYLFADRDFQSQDAKKLQIWMVYSF